MLGHVVCARLGQVVCVCHARTGGVCCVCVCVCGGGDEVVEV